MKIKEPILAGLVLLLLTSSSLLCSDLGVVTFNNITTSLVIDSRTGLPLEPGIAVAGLYYSPDLEAVPDPSVPLDSFELVAATPVSPSPMEGLWGYFNSGNVEIPGTTTGQPVLMQVRIWLAGYGTYEEALNHQAGVVAFSDLLGPVHLGGGVHPPPSISDFLSTELTLDAIPDGNNIPVAFDGIFTIREDQVLQGQLPGHDYDGNALSYSLISQPALGGITLDPDGHFSFTHFPGIVGTDSFQFTVRDGELESLPATTTIHILGLDSGGTIQFKNDGQLRVIDSRNGRPVEPNQVTVGLYISTNLNSVPNPDLPKDAFDLVASELVSEWGGIFDRGILQILGTLEGQEIMAQLRFWNQTYSSYEDALNAPDALVCVSHLIGPLTLGGVILPPPELLDPYSSSTITLRLINRNFPPTALSVEYSTLENAPVIVELSGQDPDDDVLAYNLLTLPSHGTLSLLSSRSFNYTPEQSFTGVDSFTYKVSDGEFDSAPATISIQVYPLKSVGQIIFRNDPRSQIIDSRTGLPVAPALVTAGLYISTNLNSLPDIDVPIDEFVLVATAAVDEEGGFFDRGILEVPDTVEGQDILVHVRVWNNEHNSYEEAFHDQNALVGFSDLIGPITLGGNANPVPDLADADAFTFVTLVLNNENHPPKAIDATYNIRQNAPLLVELIGQDLNHDPLAFTVITSPSHGTLTPQSNSDYLYLPNLDFTGIDSFQFVVSDGEFESPPATVTLKVLGLDSAGSIIFRNNAQNPIIDGRTGLPVEPGQVTAGLYISTNLLSIPNPDIPKDEFDLVATTLVNGEGGFFNGGDLEIPGTLEGQEVLLQVRVWDQSLNSYEEAFSHPNTLGGVSELIGPVTLGGAILPVPDLTGFDAFTAINLVVMNENHPPEAIGRGYSIHQDMPLSITLTGHDPDNEILLYDVLTQPVNGTLTAESERDFIYTPFPGFIGVDSFTFGVSDGLLLSDPSQITIYVQPTSLFGGTVDFANNAASRVIDYQTGQPVDPGVAVAGLYYSTDLDAVPDPSLPWDDFQLAAVTPVSPSPLQLLWGYFNGGTVRIPGTATGQPVLLQVRIWPAGYENFEDALLRQANMIAVSDLLGPVNVGGGISPPPSISDFLLSPMTMTPWGGTNTPVADNASFIMREDQILEGQLQGYVFGGNLLTFSLLSQPALGDVTVQPDGRFSYTPFPGLFGTDTFDFVVNDGTIDSVPATVTLNILQREGSGHIVFSNDAQTQIMDGRTGLPVAPGEVTAGLYISTNLNAIPDPGIPKDDFELVATAAVDGEGGLFDGGNLEIPGTLEGQQILLQVRIWNRKFTSYEEAFYAPDALTGVSELIGPITLGGNTLPVPELADSFAFDSITLDLINQNHRPEAIARAYEARQNNPITIALEGQDVDGDTLTLVNLPQPLNGTLTAEPDGTFLYTSDADFIGVDMFNFQVTDGFLDSAPARITIYVRPGFTSGGGTITFANSHDSLVIDHRTGEPAEPGVLVAGLYYSTYLDAVPNPSRPLEDIFHLGSVAPVSSIPLPQLYGLFSAGNVQLPGSQIVIQVRIWSVDYINYEEAWLNNDPMLAASNPAIVQLAFGASPPMTTADSDLGDLSTGLINLNRPPVALNKNYLTPEDTSFSGQLPGSDPDGDDLTFYISSDPLLGIVTFNPNGQFTYQPAINIHGTDTFTFYVTDAENESAPATVTIQITPVNDPPSAVIQLAPLASLFGQTTIPIVLAPNNTSATVLLDGSLSSDTENDPLVYAWYLNQQSTPLAYGETVLADLEIGFTTITLVVDDGTDTGTTSIDVEVVTPSDAVQELMQQIVDSNLKSNRKKPLISSLNAAQTSFDRDKFSPGVNQLGAFQNKIRAQVRKWDSALADQLMIGSTEIIEAVH